MKIYTKKGDKGTTTLYGREQRISKSEDRITAYGTVDELNSQLGFAASFIADRKLTGTIRDLQKDLFEIASELASHPKAKTAFKLLKRRVNRLERLIDKFDQELPPLANFIFPSGDKAAAALHVARTFCRRAEREVVKLAGHEAVNPNIIMYLNRLSDLLFTLARVVNKQKGLKESIWRG